MERKKLILQYLYKWCTVKGSFETNVGQMDRRHKKDKQKQNNRHSFISLLENGNYFSIIIYYIKCRLKRRVNRTNIACQLYVVNGFKCGHNDWIHLSTWLATRYERKVTFDLKSSPIDELCAPNGNHRPFYRFSLLFCVKLCNDLPGARNYPRVISYRHTEIYRIRNSHP